MTIREQLARNLAFYRKKSGYTQKAAAEKLGTKLTKKDRLKDLYVNGLINLDEYKSDREQIESDIAALTAYKPRTGPDIDSLKDLLATDFEALYTTLSAEERRFFWRSIIKEIRFGKDRHYEIIFLD